MSRVRARSWCRLRRCCRRRWTCPCSWCHDDFSLGVGGAERRRLGRAGPGARRVWPRVRWRERRRRIEGRLSYQAKEKKLRSMKGPPADMFSTLSWCARTRQLFATWRRGLQGVALLSCPPQQSSLQMTPRFCATLPFGTARSKTAFAVSRTCGIYSLSTRNTSARLSPCSSSAFDKSMHSPSSTPAMKAGLLACVSRKW